MDAAAAAVRCQLLFFLITLEPSAGSQTLNPKPKTQPLIPQPQILNPGISLQAQREREAQWLAKVRPDLVAAGANVVATDANVIAAGANVVVAGANGSNGFDGSNASAAGGGAFIPGHAEGAQNVQEGAQYGQQAAGNVQEEGQAAVVIKEEALWRYQRHDVCVIALGATHPTRHPSTHNLRGAPRS